MTLLRGCFQTMETVENKCGDIYILDKREEIKEKREEIRYRLTAMYLKSAATPRFGIRRQSRHLIFSLFSFLSSLAVNYGNMRYLTYLRNLYQRAML